MADIMESAHAAVLELGKSSDDDLYRLLGIRLKAMERDPQQVAGFAPKIEAKELGIAPGDLLGFGKTAFAQLAVAGHGVVCGADAQGFQLQRLLAAFNTDVNRVTAAVATVLVGQLAMAPAIATIVATLVIGKVAPTSVDALCRVWTKKIAGAAKP